MGKVERRREGRREGKVELGVTHMYRGPSVEGYMCEPSTLPHWPMAMKRGIPAARFVSDPRLWATRDSLMNEDNKKKMIKKDDVS